MKRVGTRTILYVMAAPLEYGPHLKSRINPLMTGIGPVEAAIVDEKAVGRLELANALPIFECSKSLFLALRHADSLPTQARGAPVEPRSRNTTGGSGATRVISAAWRGSRAGCRSG